MALLLATRTGSRVVRGEPERAGESERAAQQNGPREEEVTAAADGDRGQPCHVRYMPEFSELNGLALLGRSGDAADAV